ncbi:unnamed protein product [Aspergillus oryzae RIB40]|uniref:Uncharacterized protein n=1 Tax=Aspergillus oryzae (strain ATCC 42149 / RIB 40) TaxID=510516 RepID=Q2TX57_ASPOR|nr:unnamed protein product [Aspergillus oryzae RIB40]XP_023094115.1 unnamed protein product [Aspergillus oryzae RIB40]BAE66148.1 unnamed protein product [Aspergillus oryzae RIB40]BAE66166.1 unnamed protein product [Aspergillus oryzae RIB40]
MDQQIASYKFSSNDRQYVPNYPSLPPSLSLTGPHLVIRTGLSVGTRRLLSSSSPKAPCLQLEIELCPLLQYTLRRATPDDDPRPFVFVWSPLNEGYHQDGFILLRHTSDGKLERVSVPDAIQDPIDIVHTGRPGPERRALRSEYHCPRRKHSASLHVRYQGSPTDRPIIFRNHVIWDMFRSYRLEDGLWELQEGPCGCPGLFLDDPDITVNVAEDEGFVTLKPGEC